MATIADPLLALGALAELRDMLPSGELWRRAEAVWDRVEENLRGPSNERDLLLAHRVLDDAPTATAIDRARSMAVPVVRAELLLPLARRVSGTEREDVVEAALAAAFDVEAPRLRAELLHRLLFHVTRERQPAVLEALERAVESIPVSYARASACLDLVKCTTEPWRTDLINW